MALIGAESKQCALQTLSAINRMATVGATDSTVSANSTITALANAVMALRPVQGVGPDANTRIAALLKQGVVIGALSETHGATTLAGLAQLVASQIGVDPTISTYFG